MKAYIASVPLHLLLAANIIKTNGIRDCDLIYVPTSKNVNELLEAVKQSGLFKDIILLPNINIEYPITLNQIIEISVNRFKVAKLLKNKVYDTVYYNTDGWLLNSIVYSSLPNKKAKNIFVENGINPYITSYDTKEWYLRLFINLSFMPCMDGRYIHERWMFEPDLIGVKQSGKMIRLPKINKNDSELIGTVNTIFGYDAKLDSFEDKDILIMEQGPRKEPIDMVYLWTKVKEYVNLDKAIVKAHPRQKNSILGGIGFDLYERYVIPWEVIVLNQDTNSKTLICVFSTSCVNPKLLYDEEPRVILLYKLIGIDYSFFGKGMINFVEGVGGLYRDKDKFFIPETWEEFGEYCKKYLQ